MPPHAKETGGGHERPNHCTHYEPPFCPWGAYFGCSLRAPLPPAQRFSAKACGGGGKPSPCLRVSPMPLAFLFIFLMYCLFPCIKGDLPLTLWANLLAPD